MQNDRTDLLYLLSTTLLGRNPSPWPLEREMCSSQPSFSGGFFSKEVSFFFIKAEIDLKKSRDLFGFLFKEVSIFKKIFKDPLDKRSLDFSWVGTPWFELKEVNGEFSPNEA